MGRYFDEHYNRNLKKTQDEIKKQQAQNTATSNAYIADLNAIVDENISNSVNKVQGEVDKLPTQYQSSFDANAIQQKINERQVAERMANMGLTNSGLNRTQQTAIAIQRSNADAALRQQMNAATLSLKQQIADLYASGESQKAENSAKARYDLEQKNQAVYSTMMDNLYSNASAHEKAMIDADAKAEEARIKAAQSQREKYEKWALENGYAYAPTGQLVYTGKVKNSDGTYSSIYELTDKEESELISRYKTGGVEGALDYLDEIGKTPYTKDEADYVESIYLGKIDAQGNKKATTDMTKREFWENAEFTKGEDTFNWFWGNDDYDDTVILNGKTYTLEEIHALLGKAGYSGADQDAFIYALSELSENEKFVRSKKK